MTTKTPKGRCKHKMNNEELKSAIEAVKEVLSENGTGLVKPAPSMSCRRIHLDDDCVVNAGKVIKRYKEALEKIVEMDSIIAIRILIESILLED